MIKKYYILKRNNQRLYNDYLSEFAKDKREKILKRCNIEYGLLLIEKTCNKDHSETYTDLWTIQEGCPILWEKYTKKRLMYDYTGVVHPLIHKNGKVLTWEQYSEKLRDMPENKIFS